MSEVLQANIFFIITSIAVVVFTGLLCVALYHLIGILKNVREMTERLKRGSAQLADDVMEVRTFVREGIVGTVRSFFVPRQKEKPPRAHKKKSESSEEAQ
jgi:hypothetical protein